MFDQDDLHADRLFYLADRHADLFEWIDATLEMFDPNWQDSLTEPSDEELAEMDKMAELLLLDILGDES